MNVHKRPCRRAKSVRKKKRKHDQIVEMRAQILRLKEENAKLRDKAHPLHGAVNVMVDTTATDMYAATVVFDANAVRKTMFNGGSLGADEVANKFADDCLPIVKDMLKTILMGHFCPPVVTEYRIGGPPPAFKAPDMSQIGHALWRRLHEDTPDIKDFRRMDTIECLVSVCPFGVRDVVVFDGASQSFSRSRVNGTELPDSVLKQLAATLKGHFELREESMRRAFVSTSPGVSLTSITNSSSAARSVTLESVRAAKDTFSLLAKDQVIGNSGGQSLSLERASIWKQYNGDGSFMNVNPPPPTPPIYKPSMSINPSANMGWGARMMADLGLISPPASSVRADNYGCSESPTGLDQPRDQETQPETPGG